MQLLDKGKRGSDREKEKVVPEKWREKLKKRGRRK